MSRIIVVDLTTDGAGRTRTGDLLSDQDVALLRRGTTELKAPAATQWQDYET